MFEETLSFMKPTAEELVPQIELLFKDKKYEDITELLNDEKLKELESAVLFAFKARALARLGQADLCLHYSEISISIDPFLAAAYVARGNVMYHKKDFDKAIEDYNKAIELNQGDSYAYYNRALIWMHHKQHDRALEDCNSSIQFEPDNAPAYLTRANIWFNQKKLDLALDDYNKALELDKKYSLAYYSRGVLWYHNKDFPKAIEDFSKAIELDPTYISAYLYRASIWQSQNEYENALTDYNDVIQIDENSSSAYLGRGDTLFNQKKYKSAISDYTRCIQIDANNVHAYNNRGNAKYSLNHIEDSIEDYDHALQIDDKYRHAYYNRALSYKKLGHLHKALEDYDRYIGVINTSDDDYYFKIALSEIDSLKKSIANKKHEEIDKLIKEIKQLLLYNNPLITHYTSLSGAKSMILDSSPFRLSEGAFLNDTSEGRELFKYLSFESPKFNKDETIGEVFIEKPFIGSFVADSKHDDLTLWRMYGKEKQAEAKGCALTISKESFISNLESQLNTTRNSEGNISQNEGSFTFYRVAYKTQNKFIIPGHDNKNSKKFNTLLQQLKTKVTDLGKDEILNINKLLNEIAYLFKSAEYQYEHEVRLVVQGAGFTKIIDKETTPAKVYIELIDILPVVRKITLGPKVEKADEWAAGFNYHIKQTKEKDFFFLNKDEPLQIIISHLPFK